jgi:hypothetical protein
VRLEGLGQLKKIHLIGIRTRDLPVWSIVPQPTADWKKYNAKNKDAMEQFDLFNETQQTRKQ